NNFTNGSQTGTDKSVTMNVLPKADLLLSPPSVAHKTTHVVTDPQSATGSGSMGYTLQGVTNFNAGQTTSTHASVVAVDYQNTPGVINRTIVTGTSAAGATFGTTTHLTGLSTSSPSLAHQPDGTRLISGDDTRIAGMAYQVGDLIYIARGLTVNSS